MENNKLDKTFGQIGSIIGILILLFGIYVCFYSWVGVTTIIVGAFLAFTHTSTKVDYENKRMKFSNNLFGLISIGFWTDVKSGMQLNLKDISKSQTKSKDASGRTIQPHSDYRIFLFSEKDTEIMAVKKCDNKESAEKELIELKAKLAL